MGRNTLKFDQEVFDKFLQQKGVEFYHLKVKVESLFDEIKHGDEEHQAWLKAKIEEHFNGIF